MIQISALAKSIEDELNGSLNAVALDIKFKIHATMGNYTKAITKVSGKKQVYINGILRTTTGTYTPVKSLNNVDATLMLELAVQQEQVDDVQLILSTWTESVVGEVYTMGNWAVLITPQTSIAGVAKNASPIGSMIPLMLMLDMQFIQNGLVSNSVTWKINGETVNPTNVATTNTRSPDTNPRANLGVVKNTNQFDNETIVMTLPISFSTIIQNLLNDVRGHLVDAVYRITRQDNFSDNLDALYSLTSAELVEEGGKIAAITLTFNPADLDATGFILSFDSDGGNNIAPKEVYYGKAIGGLSTPRKAGYVFDGWYVDGNLITEDTICEFSEDKIAVASWYSKGLVFTYMQDKDAYAIGNPNAPIANQYGTGLTDEWQGGSLYIPGKYKGKNVIEIAKYAFYKFNQVNAFNINSVTLSEGLKTIGVGAFYYCNQITTIHLPSTVETIEQQTFTLCQALTTINIPNNVTTIEYGTFYQCINLSSITLSNTLETIEKWAFLQCYNLTAITLPNTLTTIGEEAFRQSGLTSVVIPDNVEEMGQGAFERCTSLTEITLSNLLTEIATETFYNCASLTTVNLPSGLKKINTFAFYGCSSLTSITLPNGLTHLYASSFSHSGLTSVDVPSSVVYAGGGIFSYCPLTVANIYTISVSKVTQGINSWFLAVPSGAVLHIPSSVSDASATYGTYWNYVGTSGGVDIRLTYYADLT